MPPQYVKPYVKTNKHDAADAEGCCEAVQRPNMRFVPVKSETQQALLMLHRIRDRLMTERTGSINAIRGHMSEFGIVTAKRTAGMKELLAIIADLDDRLPPLARELLVLAVAHLRDVEGKIAELDARVRSLARDHVTCRRLSEAPGIGPVIATAMVATVGDARSFDEWTAASGVARSHPTPALDRRQRTTAWDQQARRRLLAAPAHARCSIDRPTRQGPCGQALDMDQRPARAAPVQHGRGCLGKQARPRAVGVAQPWRDLPCNGLRDARAHQRRADRRPA
jgi:transposase